MAEDVNNNLTEILDLPDPPISTYSMYTALQFYARHIIPFFCLIGIVGNCMALLLIRTNYWLRRLTSNIYLCTLSICGCLFLSTVFITWMDSSRFLYKIFAISLSIYNDSQFGCKALTFIAHTCDFVCVWMISWISCDRAIVLYRPGIRKYVCTKSFARKLTFGTVMFGSLLYSNLFITAGLETIEGTTYCGAIHSIGSWNLAEIMTLFHFCDTILCTVIPSVLVMIVNSLSIYRYRECMKIYASGVLRVRFLRVPNSDCPPMEETTVNKKLLLSAPSQTQFSTQSSRSTTTWGRLKSSDLQLSRSLLVVTSTFVLLNVPSYVFRLYYSMFEPRSQLFTFLVFIGNMIFYFHHTVLFYMYFFWSPQMKKQLRPTALKLLECYCFKTVPEFGHSQVSVQLRRID